jgi:polysaccharide biosynthesis/export protein
MTKKPFISAVLLISVLVLFTACRSSQKINQNYLSADRPDSTSTRIWQSYEAKIQPGDRLSIFVTALNPTSAQIFNLSGGSGSGTGQGQSGYSVDQKGNILFPQLGFIHVGGYTKDQIRDTLLNRVSVYLKDPVVVVELINMKVTVLGEVAKQGPILLQEGRINILEALGQAGDINVTGRRDSVLVIREENNKREFGYVNLLSNEVFKSPYFMLQQNDVVVVPMNQRKAVQKDEQSFAERAFPYLSAVTSLGTLIVIIYNLFK